MNLRKIVLTVAALVVVISGVLFFWPHDACGEEPLDMVIIVTSNLQSQLEPFPNSTGSHVGGTSRISTMKAAIDDDVDATLLVSSGDDMIGTFYDMFSGRPEMESMTAAGYDVVCPGNHDFDYGAMKYRQAAVYAGFPIVCSNIRFEDHELERRIRESVMLDKSGVKIGVFSLMTPDLPRLSSPGPGVSVDPDLSEVSRRMVEGLRSDGADLVIALTHTGVEIDRRIAEEVSGIDLIIGGLDYENVYEKVQGPDGWETIIVQDGIHGVRPGVLRFSYDGGNIENPVLSRVWLDNNTPGDPEVDAIINPYLTIYKERLSQSIGVTDTPLDTRKSTVRRGEAAAGNLICDAWRSWFSGDRIVFFNGGGIRGDTVYPAGNVTYQIIREMLPYNDEIVEIELTGSEIRDVLECSASALGPEYEGIETGGFLQVSGLWYTIDMNETPYSAKYNGSDLLEVTHRGSRVKKVLVEEPDGSYSLLDDDLTYPILVNAWLAGGGDGYWIFAAAKNKTHTAVHDIDPVMDYIRKNTPVAPAVEGRITKIGS